MTRTKRIALPTVLLFVAFALSVDAAPIQIAQADFGPSATTISFSVIPHPLPPPPVIPGLVFICDFCIGEPPSTWDASAPPFNSLSFGGEMTIKFDTPVKRVGFFFGGNTVNTVPFSLGFAGATTGSYTLRTFGTPFAMPPDGVNNWIFFGFEDPEGIDSLMFDRESSHGWIVGIGELRLERDIEVAAVPEPSALVLLATGVGLATFVHRRKSS
jgi:hypothetical protein